MAVYSIVQVTMVPCRINSVQRDEFLLVCEKTHDLVMPASEEAETEYECEDEDPQRGEHYQYSADSSLVDRPGLSILVAKVCLAFRLDQARHERPDLVLVPNSDSTVVVEIDKDDGEENDACQAERDQK